MVDETLADVEERMGKSIESLIRDLNTVRTGRASPALLDRIVVEYFGTPTPLNQLAGVTSPEPTLLLVQPWDKTTIPDIEKSILKSDIGISPSNDGTVIRIAIPPLSEERRLELVKIVHSKIEDAKVACRNIRRDAMSQVREMMSEKLISEDDERRAEHNLDEITKRFTDEADSVGKAKEAEVMEV